MRVLAAVDKFRGTLTASEVADAIASACSELGHECTKLPISDGGEGLLEAVGGPNMATFVTGPLGDPVDAHWRLDNGVAVIETAQACGLLLAGGAAGNDPLGATTAGVGELIESAIAAGAHRIVLGIGGSATSDGGLGAIGAIKSIERLGSVDLMVASDVEVRFVDAGVVFGPQKGADDAIVSLITDRLAELAATYLDDFGVDVKPLRFGGAGGGLAGGLVALGGTITSGFDLVASEVDLASRIARSDLVITGEGSIDKTSRVGKVVGGVHDLCVAHGVPVHAIGGIVSDADWIDHTSLTEAFGSHRSLNDTARCVTEATLALLSGSRTLLADR